jgi:hypothetical protein
MPNPLVTQPSYFKQSWQFLSDYFLTSTNKWQARALLFGCVVLTLVTIGLGFVIGWWVFPFIRHASNLVIYIVLLSLVGGSLSIMLAS